MAPPDRSARPGSGLSLSVLGEFTLEIIRYLPFLLREIHSRQSSMQAPGIISGPRFCPKGVESPSSSLPGAADPPESLNKRICIADVPKKKMYRLILG